jgi:hypothetical protein
MSGAEIPIAALALGGVSAGTSLYGTSKAAAAQETGKQASLMAAQEQSKAYEFEAGQLDRQAGQYDLQAGQYDKQGGQYDLQAKRIRSAAAVDEAARRTDLESSLETIDAMRSGRGLSLDSPTGRAISRNVTATGERNIMTSKTNFLLDAEKSGFQGEQSRFQGEQTRFQGEQSRAQAELSRLKARYSLLAGEAGASAADDQIAATWAGGVGKVASIGMSFYKTPAVR